MSYKVIMSFADLIRISFFSFNSYKLRIFLTMIGIIISISSVVVILSIGDGLKKEISRPMEYDSPNKFNVNFEPNDNNFEFGLNKPFDKIDIYYINNIEGVEKAESTKGIGGLNLTSVQINYFDKNVFTIVTDYDYEEKELDILYGRSFVENEKTDKKIVLEFETAKTIFNSPKEAIGRGVEINRENYEVIGVLGKVSGFSLTSNSSYVLKEAIEDMNIESDITGIDIYIKPDYDVNEVFVDIAKKLEENHPNMQGQYILEDPKSMTNVIGQIIDGITSFISLVTSLSLFVGGIGVMNIMYVSVSERKREIGIKRAIGAKSKDILIQFIFEASFITGVAGLIGIICGFVFSKIVGVMLPFNPVITLNNFIIASTTSILVGVIFGIMPAIKASNMEPINAIYN